MELVAVATEGRWMPDELGDMMGGGVQSRIVI